MSNSLLIIILLALASRVNSHPLCLDLSAPSKPASSLTFCTDPAYSKSGCCSVEDDLQISVAFKALNITDSACSATMKKLYCSQCDPFAAQLFGVEGRPVTAHAITSTIFSPPYLCGSATETNGTQCAAVYNTCGAVPISYLPFAKVAKYAPAIENPAVATTLQSYYVSASAFCGAYRPDALIGDVCYAGKPYEVPAASDELASAGPGVCVEKVLTGAVTSMVPHPDGSARAFVTLKSGKVFIVNVGGGKVISRNVTEPFLDLSTNVNTYGNMGLNSISFHPNFKSNGKFYVSYNCDSSTIPNKCGRSFVCPCGEGLSCTASGTAVTTCRNATVVAEYLATGDSFLASEAALPQENRRILTYGQPFPNALAGQIQFGPLDSLLYVALGDGGSAPYTFVAQNLNVLLGKILRIDVNDQPLGADTSVYGNYSIPSENPFVSQSAGGNVRGEIFAVGLRNPSWCTFDSSRPTYLFCADQSANGSAEVNLVEKGGNYGWGSTESIPSTAILVNSSISAALSLPKTSYVAPLSGGYMYRGTADSCLNGRYLFNDKTDFYAGTENPPFSGRFESSKLTLKCSTSTPLPCSPYLSTGAQSFQRWAQSNTKDLYMLASGGVFRLVDPTECGFTCLQNLPSPFPPPSPPSPSPPPYPPPAPTTPAPPIPPASPPPPPLQAPLAPGEDPRDYGPAGKTPDYWLKTGIVLGLIVFWLLFVVCGCCLMGYYRYRKEEEKAEYEQELTYQTENRSEYSASEYDPEAEDYNDRGTRRVYYGQ